VVLNSLVITNGNSSYGGGIDNGGTLTVNACTIVGNANSAYGYPGGGGICNFGTLTVNQSTITGNSASCNGAGIFLDNGTVVLHNSIVAGNSGSADINSFTAAGVNLTSGNPLLAPLGNYGGPTPTMPPLPGSPAIDGCTSGTGFATDQRGFPRAIGPFADIGAVELQTPTLVASNNADTGLGSLRQAIRQADVSATITFASNLSGATVTLTGGTLLLNKNLIIDGSGLVNGITINGNHNGSVFNVASGNTVVLNSLVITNGSAPGGYGGGVENNGMLAVNRCTVTGNTAYLGGGVFNRGNTLTVNQCTVEGNSASDSCFGERRGHFQLCRGAECKPIHRDEQFGQQ
jgi:hypothetical protein